MTYLVTKKVLKGRQVDVGSGLAWLAERQIQQISYFTHWQSLERFYTQMAQTQRNEKLREGSKLQSSQSQNWAAWKTDIVPPVWRNKHCKPLAGTRIEIRRINLEISHRLHLRRSPSSRVTTTVRILATIVKNCEKTSWVWYKIESAISSFSTGEISP